MALTGLMTEALLLGVSSGPVCLASCSPVLVPVLAAEQRSPRGTGALLAQFLGAGWPVTWASPASPGFWVSRSNFSRAPTR